MDDLKSVSHMGHSLQYLILISDIDFADDVIDISDISTSLDFPRLNVYRVGEVTITITDPDGRFAINRADNFFVQNSEPQDGVGVDVEVKAGYLDAIKTIFKGKILKISQDSPLATTEITVLNSIHQAYRQEITDFGESKRFRITPNAEERLNGLYPLPEWLLPLSKGSVNVYNCLLYTSPSPRDS